MIDKSKTTQTERIKNGYINMANKINYQKELEKSFRKQRLKTVSLLFCCIAAVHPAAAM